MTSSKSEAAQPVGTGKIFYIDHLKVFLTALVVMHHVVVTYNSADGWYYNEPSPTTLAHIPMTMFLSINQSFFMGFFFLLSAYFIPASYRKKGGLQFIKDRLVRLGIPLLFYTFILSPFLSYLVYYFAKGNPIGYLEYLQGYDDWIDPGVTWFVAALLIFNIGYVTIRLLFRTSLLKPVPASGSRGILLFAAGLGIISFLVRIVFPVGWVLEPLGFQPGHFTQYIALFIIGIVAYKNDWLNTLSDRTGKNMRRSALLALLFFPVFLVIALVLKTLSTWFSGGWHWQSFLYAVWEQWIGISIITALVVKGKNTWNTYSGLMTQWSKNSFAVYIFHSLVIVAVTLAIRNWDVDPAVKVLPAAIASVVFSYALGFMIGKIPFVKKIF